MKKMLMVVVPHEEAEYVLDALIKAGHSATFTETRGGMLRQSQLTLYIAIEEEQLEEVLGIVRDNCHVEVQVGSSSQGNERSLGPVPVTTGLGGAVVFIWNLEQLVTY
jgi:uncharacterized protein YaaQ